ncbi:hypothetical protein [Xanthomarina sp.]|uniref:hypothetical protein n=1 Tax=Xanthomarina sp. TaxID=1931211 RepID=UPI002C2A6DE5|nr:hypothetical protein [Xanthomarina sp.]HLV38526.1 hypothetical protein [Xanthomarina sp.]
MTLTKKISYIFISFIVLIILFYGWYKYTHSMEEAPSFEVNSSENLVSLLIATQGSDFKNAVTNNIVNYFKDEAIFIKVIDVSKLNNTEAKDFNSILLIHTWENTKPPAEIEKFINNNKELRKKTVVYTTSGDGSYKMKNVDALTGESNLEDIDQVSKQIIEKLKTILKTAKTEI